MSDAFWIEAIRRGDERAFEALYLEYKDRVYRYACSMSGVGPAAEDLVQDAFLGFLRNIDQLRPNATVLPYLLRSVRNRHIDQKRSFASRGRPLETATRATAGVPAPPDQSWERERHDLIQEAIDSLPPDQADVVRLRLFGKLDYAAIGEEVSAPAATVRSRYRSALDSLRQRLGRTIGDV
ncbi:MAG: sigma-70 family RNA polymerase sigma factor [Planctomycetota bacterium]